MPKQLPTNETVSVQENKGYKPSKWALNRIGEIPKEVREGLKKVYGLDISEVVNSAKRYGIVEGLAGNNFTLHPVRLSIDKAEKLRKEIIDKSGDSIGDPAETLKWIPDMGKEEGWYTVRLWILPESKKWGLETHEAKLGFDLDENREVIKKDDASEKKTWDRNPLSDNEYISYRGNIFSKDQMDHLRLTGTLGSTLTELGAKLPFEQKEDKIMFRIKNQVYIVDSSSVRTNEAIKADVMKAYPLIVDPADPTKTVADTKNGIEVASKSGEYFQVSNLGIYLDEYNNHEVVAYSPSFMKLQLESKLKNGNVFYMDGKPYCLDPNGISEAADGGYVWAFAVTQDPNDPEKKIADKSNAVNVWFDPRTRAFRPTIPGHPSMDYEQAIREENKRNRAAAKKAQETSQKQTNQVKQSVPKV